MALSDFITTSNEILNLINRKYPHIYDEISKDELTLFSFILHIESLLHEVSLEYMSSYISEQGILTCETYESLINHAITRGYTPRFSTPSSGIINCFIPVYDITEESKALNTNTTLYFDKNIVILKGKTIKKKQDVFFRLKYNYKFTNNMFASLLYRINDDGTTQIQESRKTTLTIDNVKYVGISFELEVEQISDVIEHNGNVFYRDNLDFPSLQLPFPSEHIYNLSRLDVFVNNQPAYYTPVLSVSNLNHYYYTIRMSDKNISIIFSNGIYGKKVLDGSSILVRVYLTEGEDGNIQENSLQFVTNITNETTGSGIDIITSNNSFSNGSYIESELSIKHNILSRLISGERIITLDDYVTTLESIFYGKVKVFPTSRFYSFGTNEVAIYLAIKKGEDKTYGTPMYYFTDTKSVLITQNDFDLEKVKQIGDYIIVPSNILLQESSSLSSDILINKSKTVCTIYSLYNKLEDISDDSIHGPEVSQMWIPLYSYILNRRYPLDNNVYLSTGTKITAPSSSSTDTVIYSYMMTLISGVFRTEVELQNIKQSNSWEVTIILPTLENSELINYANNLWNEQTSTYKWLILKVFLNGQIINTYVEPNSTAYDIQTKTISFKVNFKSELKINSVTDVLVEYYFKPLDTSLEPILVSRVSYSDVDVFSNNEANQYLKVSKLPETLFPSASNDDIMIIDVPVISVSEIRNNPFAESVLADIKSVIKAITSIITNKTPIGCFHNILLGRTSGVMLEYLFNFLKPVFVDDNYQQSQPAEILLPINIQTTIRVRDKNYSQLVSETVKDRILTFVQSTSSFFAKYDVYDMIVAVSDIDNLQSIKVSIDNIYSSVRSIGDISLRALRTNNINPWYYRLFVPSLIHTTSSNIYNTVK